MMTGLTIGVTITLVGLVMMVGSFAVPWWLNWRDAKKKEFES